LLNQVPFWVREWLLVPPKVFCYIRLLNQVPFWVHEWLLVPPKVFCYIRLLSQVPFWVHELLLASHGRLCSMGLLFRYHFPVPSLTAISFLIPRYKHYWRTERSQHNCKYPVSQWANKSNSGPAKLHKGYSSRCRRPQSPLLLLQYHTEIVNKNF